MKLYHYSFNDKILSQGLVASVKHNDTEIINNLISEQYNGDCFSRDYCVFFNFNCRDIGDLVVSVDSDNLNTDELYVADQDLADEIYRKWYKGYNVEHLINKYVDSITSFSSYNNEYTNPEIMYLNDVPPELLTVEENS